MKNTKIVFTGICMLAVFMLTACGNETETISGLNNPAIVSMIDRVQADEPELQNKPFEGAVTETDGIKFEHMDSKKGEEYKKYWVKDTTGGVAISKDDYGQYTAVSETGNRTDDYTLEVMYCNYENDNLNYYDSIVLNCTRDSNDEESREFYQGSNGNFELVKNVPEPGKNFVSDDGSKTVFGGETDKGSKSAPFLSWTRN